VVLSAALLHDPKVLVLDEPMVGLDPRAMRLVKDILRRRTRAGGCVLMSTHTLEIAEQIADRIGIIHKGRLLAVGTPAEILAGSRPGATLEDVFLEMTCDDRTGNGSPPPTAPPADAAARPADPG
jgi:ABC-2 type transport system ATP-binding protein